VPIVTNFQPMVAHMNTIAKGGPKSLVSFNFTYSAVFFFFPCLSVILNPLSLFEIQLQLKSTLWDLITSA